MHRKLKCSEKDCKNKFYAFDKISPTHKVALCRKHYRMFALGYSEYELSIGKRVVTSNSSSAKAESFNKGYEVKTK